MERKNHWLSLGVKTAFVIIFLSILLVAVATLTSYLTYASKTDARHKRVAYNVARTAAARLNADKIALYAKTLQTDDEYYEMFDELLEIKSNNDVLWLYVVNFSEQGSYFIMDADTGNPCELGEEYIIDDALLPDIDKLYEGIPVSFMSDNEFGRFVTSFAPLCDANGRFVAMVCADIPMSEVMADRERFLIILCAGMFATAAVYIAVFLYLTRKYVSGPIDQLAKAAGSFVSEREAPGVVSAISALDIRTGDEIERLSETFKLMEHELNEYIDNLTLVTAEKERISAELSVAREIQSSLLPCIFPPFPERSEFDIHATMLPAKEVGGDFYDFFFVDKDTLAVVMADVSGKGVPAALFMVISKTLIKNNANLGKTPKEVFETVNNLLCENNDAEMFVTAFMGYYHIRESRFVYVNAGHNPPLIHKAGGSYEYMDTAPCIMLAAFEGVKYNEAELEFSSGDTLYLYTDGVTEALNEKEELFAEERLQLALNQNKDCSVKELLLHVKNGIDHFANGAEQSDDITMLALRAR